MFKLSNIRSNFINGIGECGRGFHINLSQYYGYPVINCTGLDEELKFRHISHGYVDYQCLTECTQCFLKMSEEIMNAL